MQRPASGVLEKVRDLAHGLPAFAQARVVVIYEAILRDAALCIARSRIVVMRNRPWRRIQ